jgi:hypothetical protein
LYLEKWTSNPKLSQEIHSSEKYKTSAQEKKPTPSTSAGNVWLLITIYKNMSFFFNSGHPILCGL